jgi:hypothetical protein
MPPATTPTPPPSQCLIQQHHHHNAPYNNITTISPSYNHNTYDLIPSKTIITMPSNNNAS